MGMTTSFNASGHIIQIVHPLDIKRDSNAIFHNTDIPFTRAMMSVQLYHMAILY